MSLPEESSLMKKRSEHSLEQLDVINVYAQNIVSTAEQATKKREIKTEESSLSVNMNVEKKLSDFKVPDPKSQVEMPDR